MKGLLRNGYKAKLRPSGHDISKKFSIDNRAAIPPNLIAIANTESNSAYLRFCQQQGIKPNPARYPAALPEYFIRMLTDKGDLILDPFAGSCVTGEVAERLKRRWICCEIIREYIEGGISRFNSNASTPTKVPSYNLLNPSIIWRGSEEEEQLPRASTTSLEPFTQISSMGRNKRMGKGLFRGWSGYSCCSNCISIYRYGEGKIFPSTASGANQEIRFIDDYG